MHAQVRANPSGQRRRPQSRQQKNGQGAGAVPDLRHAAGMGVQPSAVHVSRPAGAVCPNRWGAFFLLLGCKCACCCSRRASWWEMLSVRLVRPLHSSVSHQPFGARQLPVVRQVAFRHTPLHTTHAAPHRDDEQGVIQVDGPAKVQGSDDGTRVVATFTAAELRWGRSVRIPFPIAAFSPTGYIDTLYLDTDLRVRLGVALDGWVGRWVGGCSRACLGRWAFFQPCDPY